MNRSSIIKYLLLLLLISIMAVASSYMTRYLLAFGFNKGSNDWIGYSGNIIGGILGGLCTLLGVSYAFNLEKQKGIRDGIPNKIVTIYILRQEIINHNFVENYSNSVTQQDALRNLNLFLRDIKKFRINEEDCFNKASQVDTEIFTTIDHYFKSLEIIEKRIYHYIEESSLRSFHDINQEIRDATEFHINLIEIAKEILYQKQNEYVKNLHKQKKPKQIIKQFNEHAYLEKIKREQNE